MIMNFYDNVNFLDKDRLGVEISLELIFGFVEREKFDFFLVMMIIIFYSGYLFCIFELKF